MSFHRTFCNLTCFWLYHHPDVGSVAECNTLEFRGYIEQCHYAIGTRMDADWMCAVHYFPVLCGSRDIVHCVDGEFGVYTE